MNREEIYEILLEQLSYDMNCSPEIIINKGISVVEAGKHPKRRKFKEEAIVFGMLTLGTGAVLSARKELLADLESFRDFKYPLRLFEHFKMTELDLLLKKHGFSITGLSEFYLPNPDLHLQYTLDDQVRIDWYEGDDVANLYQYQGFDNALSYYIRGLRPDVIAVSASVEDKVIAVAGASADGEKMWQVGIDVVEEHRNKGLATYLVSELTKRILHLGKVPYYGTWSANIASRKIALKCGYRPAWTEVY